MNDFCSRTTCLSMFVSPACFRLNTRYSWKCADKNTRCSSFLSRPRNVGNFRLSRRRSCVEGNFLVRLDYGVFASDSWIKNLLVVTGVATTLWFFTVVERIIEEKRKAELLEQGATSCPLCDGTGYIDCLCTKWTFPSSVSERRPRVVQCTRCHGSQKERCPRCGGGGLLSPIPAPVRVDVN